MDIIDIIAYVLSFTVFYFIIGKAFRKVDEILEKKLSKKVYDASMIAIFILVFVIALYIVFAK